MLWKETRQYFFNAVLKVCTAIDLSTHSHAITPQPTSEIKGLDKKAIVITFNENFHGKKCMYRSTEEINM